jgi:thiol-disulfide isomerase/thioredoxin
MRSFFLIGLITLTSFSYAQKTGYQIQFKITGLPDTTLYLGHFYGESTYAKDTAYSKNGVFVFDGKTALPQGVYFLIKGSAKLGNVDFVIGNNQHFKMETSLDDFVNQMKVTGDLDNQLFFQNLQFNAARTKEAEPHIKVLQDTTLKDETKKKEAREAYTKISEKVIAYQDDLIAKNPTTMTARLLKTSKRVDIPEPPKKADGTIDSTFQLRYYREHYFDYFDLSDDALIRLPRPIYSEKINEYLDKLYAPQADTLLKAIDFIVSRAKKNQETYKYTVFSCIIKYQNPEIMGLDEVFVRLYDKYFATGEMDFWANEKFKGNLKEHADRLRKSLVGQKGANLIMQDENFKPRSMYDIKNKYTILFIFDPDCGHCKTETPKLVKFYNENKSKFDIEVFAVSADTSMAKMKDYIKTMKMPWITVNGPRTYTGSYHDHYDAITTPSMYILDENKKIIAKKPPIEKLVDFFTNYEKYIRKKGQPTTKSTP